MDEEIWHCKFLNRWMKTVPCNCDNGYSGPFGFPCGKCEGNLQYDVIVPNPPSTEFRDGGQDEE